jgi:transcriptional regulator with GAF, ATPase, and Fis domain
MTDLGMDPAKAKGMDKSRKASQTDCKPVDDTRADERRLVMEVLQRNGWNIGQAAREMGIAQAELMRLLRRYGLRDAL